MVQATEDHAPGVAPTSQDDTFLDVQQVADLLGINRATVFRHLKRGSLPQPRRYSRRCIRFSRAEILAFVPDLEGGDGQS